MYAEIRIFDDCGRPKTDRPYIVPSTKIDEMRNPSEDSIITQYTFKFMFSERTPKNPCEFEIIDRCQAAYDLGYKRAIEEHKWRGGKA